MDALMRAETGGDDVAPEAGSPGENSLSIMRSIVRRMNGFLYRCHNDTDFTMMFMEGAVDRVTGYSRDAFTGAEKRSYAGIIHPDDVETVDSAVAAAVEARGNWEVDYRIKRADGGTQWVHESGGGVYGPDGALSHLEGVVIDVNNKKTRELENSTALLERVGATSQEIIANTGAILRILQTLQLLALNARIEAARAGEYGAGFTVVATEIKSLADESGVSAERITKLSEELQGILRQRA
ncbi:MAG: PAS domain-containing protein [Salinarimonas sp.]|nr:PAS domain-containing protein [Salinarimonas sp.]